MIFFVLFATSLAPMSLDERESTGFSKLNRKERAALEHWIENHYEKRAYPLTSRTSKLGNKRPYIEENLNGGRSIRLSNDTLWEIHPVDAKIAQGWITPAEISVSNGQGPDYPARLVNLLTGSCVRARPAAK